ncbi:exodeoxyribonuclease V subunit gamma [Pseudoxanthomonas sp. F11]|uniref:exodeoxyribonuclease V subunit gamma n=1 Tax=Pseudoxanthomonas sp. F11 TaxID=3126308 RepID=UPI00300CAB90
MTADAAPDFRLYPSNALELLAALLAEELRNPVPGQSPLAPDVVLIPQVAMRRWLQATLATRYGVAANLEFLTPGEFVARALDANLGPSTDDLDMAALQWRLYGALGDPTLRGTPAMASLDAWLGDGDPLKPWALAGELAGVYEKYQAWRRDWLLRWEAGADQDDAQARLWRAVAAGRDYRARRIHDYLARFGRDDGPLPQGLPKRLLVFATLNISPDVLRVLATQARVGTLHFYLPTPARGYWGDLQTLRERRRSGDSALFADDVQENPLLQAWGAAGRDFMALLGDYEVVHPRAEIDVYADPLSAQGPDTLLRRLQSDLFHRRAPAVPPPRAWLGLADASLQVHACHTRLRELQVLHDQLRGLLDDPRFDPPLQPREIAVLAPDIDPYVPYLDAVFGGTGHDDALPWALADTSPLASEPLAEVFLRLLDLPVSRFGLDEVLDLLASAPMAEASGLDSDAIDRLHGWLRQAGARWGLDAAHRVASDAPADDAYTWQFALDRLLLGHASGSEDEIAGVAPWPELEGSGLDALDTLVRLLRELARQRRVLGEAQTPARWRERLLHLLDALLPERPVAPRAQRALDRLRTLIDGFARDAEAAGYGGTVPPEVVRAHFADLLSQADTRAPLLTGGISVGRMVPMRLLPFRVICLLGMNDGDFPRRDPAAGLNKLTAELHAGRRLPGDRSTREDDRFLFLQLFAAAQDVFYLSYLGNDPRDGSVREPSVLVSELLDVAARYHADPDARMRLVVRHTLQPFAPEAFGSGDEPRRFSYRARWREASQRLGQARHALAPWLLQPLPPEDAGTTDLSLDALRRFFADPQGRFLQQRLGLRLPEPVDQGEDVEPLVVPGRGLERARLQQALIDAMDAGQEAGLRERLRARALLPSGALGTRQFEAMLAQASPFARARRAWLAGETAASAAYAIELDGRRLHGRVADVTARGLVRLRADVLNGTAALRWGLDWLLANAAGARLPLVQFHDGDHPGPHLIEALAPEQARTALRCLLALHARGLQAPLLFAPSTGWDIWNAEPGKRRAAGWKRWHGDGNGGWAEGEGEAIRLALRGRDPFARDDDYAELERTSLDVYDLLRHGRTRHDGDAA